MKISLENIGKIKTANIEINGITVIAGENNTGKSTVGKALFSIFYSFLNVEKKIKKERQKLLEATISRFAMTSDWPELGIEYIFSENKIERNMSKTLMKLQNLEKEEIKTILAKGLKISEKNITSEEFNELETSILDILNLPNKYILKNNIENNLRKEFNNQINNIYNNSLGKIELDISKKKITTLIKEENIEELKNSDDKLLSLYLNPIYIDNPFVIENITGLSYFEKAPLNMNHTEFLKYILTSENKKNLVEDALVKKDMEEITKKLQEVFKGNVIISDDDLLGKKFKYKSSDSDKELDIKNLSAGLKTFAIIKILLEKGMLEKKGTLILDEPEIHLHPEWQLKFAELIVLLQKEFNLHVLLTTHSPYFLRALQVYAGNYGIADKCKYYLAENEGRSSIIKDVSTDTELIYQKLAHPFQKLENLANDE